MERGKIFAQPLKVRDSLCCGKTWWLLKGRASAAPQAPD